ncbi:hypothetical protein [Winogradskyella sp. A2]|uniref:hypothetical protein n=1 Tax=Winogradskyella sp. A2 TaxID=3366944 RepID=UPI00398C4C5D
MNFFRKIFRQKKTKAEPRKTVPRPENWNKTLSDLMQEMKDGKRHQVGQPETDWALEYERSLIPENYRYPKEGDLYESKFDQEIEFLTAWSAPFTGGGKATLYKGEQIWINSEPNEEKPIGSYALPVNYSELEKRMVSKTDRNASKYGNFYFHFDTVILNDKFNLIQTGFKKKPWE